MRLSSALKTFCIAIEGLLLFDFEWCLPDDEGGSKAASGGRERSEDGDIERGLNHKKGASSVSSGAFEIGRLMRIASSSSAKSCQLVSSATWMRGSSMMDTVLTM